MIGSHTFLVSGDCNLFNSVKIHQSLIEIFDQDGPITVDLAEVGAVDVSFIQLIVSASRTAAQHKRSFTLVGMPGGVEASFRRAGIDVGPMCRPTLPI